MTKVFNSRDLADIQQPIDRDGYSNDAFDKLYKNNPYHNSERDRKKKKKSSSIQETEFSKDFLNKKKDKICELCGLSYEYRLKVIIDNMNEKTCEHD